jgi:release factor glutamine methyltransferase
MMEKELWTIQKLLDWTSKHFSTKGIGSARLDTELLLARALGCKRLDLYLKFDQPLKPEELSNFKEMVKRRSQKEPVAYILGEKEFYGRGFSVGPGVLIPRPETEHLIDTVLEWVRLNSGAAEFKKEEQELKILDVGSGSGAIGVTLALEFPKSHVKAIEASHVAAQFTETNAAKLGASVEVLNQDFESYAQSTTEIFDVVASNPPYIGRLAQDTLQEDVKGFEPEQALYGGNQGHELLTKWLPLYVKLLKPNGLLVFEIGSDQGEIVKKLLAENEELDQIQIIQDYSGHPRIARAIKKVNNG